MVRQFLAQKLYMLVDALEPYVDGTMGPISATHTARYLEALKVLGALYRVYDRVPLPEPARTEPKALERAEVLRSGVLAQLVELEQRAKVPG